MLPERTFGWIRISRGRKLALMLATLATLPFSSPGAVRTWDGGGRGTSWDDSGNWNATLPLPSAPAPGDDLVFPAGALRLSNTNDFANGTGFNRITWSGAGYTAGGNQVELAAGIVVSHATGTTVVNLPVSLASVQTFEVTQAGASLTLNGNVNLGSRSLTITGAGNTTVAGAMSGSLNLGSVRKTGTGTLTISSNPSYTGNTTVHGGTLSVSGSLPNSTVIVNSGGTLRGTGPVDGITANSGATVRPGTSTFFASDLVSTDNVTLNAGSTLVIGLNGATHGSGYGGLDVTGTVTLGGTLSLSTAFTPDVGTRFTIISNDGTDEVAGTFAGLPDGAEFVVGGRRFRIHYGTGIGLFRKNDVVVEAIPALKIWDGGGGVNHLWTEPTNWNDDTIPLSGDDIQFPQPAGPTTLLTTNDFPAGTVFGALILPVSRVKLEGNAAAFDGGVLDMASTTSGTGTEILFPLTLRGGITLDYATVLSVASPVNLGGNQTIRVNHSAASLRMNAPVDLAGHDLTVDQAQTTSGGGTSFSSVTGAGTLTKTGAGRTSLSLLSAESALVVNGGRVSAGSLDGAVTVNAGEFFANGSLAGPVNVGAGGTFGAGGVQNMDVNGGIVDLTFSSIEITGTVNLFGGAVVRTEIYKAIADGESVPAIRRLYPINSAALSLNGASFTFTIAPDALSLLSPGDALHVVRNPNAAFNGTFTGLPEGTLFTQDGHIFTMAYPLNAYGSRHAALLVDLPLVWDGGGSGNLWTTPANWTGDLAPIAGAAVAFPPGVTKKAALNDYPDDSVFRALNFADAGYVCAGNRIRLRRGMTQSNASGENRVVNDLFFSPIGTMIVTVDGAGRLKLEGAITGNATVEKKGTGILHLTGADANTGAVSWKVTGGELELAKSRGIAIAGSLTIGDGTNPALVTLLENEQIGDSVMVTVAAAARFDPGGQSETINGLNGAGTVSLGRGFLPGRLTVNSGNFAGILSGTGFLTKTGASPLTLSGTGGFSGRVIADDGTLTINGSLAQSEVLLNGGTLRGAGQIGDLTGNTGGVVQPGNNTPASYVSLRCANVNLNAATTFLANISGTDPGVETQKLDVTGTVSPGGCALGVSLIFNPVAAAGRLFTIIENDGNDPVQGTFAALPHGSVFVRDGLRWQVSYTGGTGNDVVLTLLELLPPAISSSSVTTSETSTSVNISGVAPERTICDLEASTDLMTWGMVRTMTATADGTFNFNYIPPASARRYCFRVRIR